MAPNSPDWERRRNTLLEQHLQASEPEDDGAARYRVDDQSWHDLGMDAVFGSLAEGLSVAGAQVLYHRLRHPALDAGDRPRVEALLEGLAKPEAERWLGKPVIAINTATYWHALRNNGIEDKVPGFGRLLLDY